MAKVLFVKANDRPADQAVSVKLYEEFLKTYKEAHPQDEVTELDLFALNLPYYGNTTITALYKQSQGWDLTAEEKQAADLANGYLDQFLAAEKVVLAFPLWNFTVPAPLITYLSYLSQAGKTFKYTAEGPVGLAGNKKVALLTARGGVYSVPPMDSIEHALKLVQATIGFWGITQTEEVVIEGHNADQSRSQQIIADGLKRAAEVASKF
ncbi:FMN-dependent NADH-azoreductase [Paenibacillus protaetiae]|uniref:FMN dependent NADH:quinone oxidoreductase n=1 Tax=Paenibacillus protaetiae TaxID=2509456 RepID=A0A4P6EUN0_9BACL|nr:FMN-dependent NADH-azoreductase [Paenibacillus protaetiae]QAY66682.1 FMN-dependent NADH-azoreductase [Paenibacillus protaetiae]